jgi:hypothetical protein
VRVLLDENLPHDLAKELTGHVVSSGECDVFVTIDGSIEHQENFTNLAFGVVVINALANRMAHLLLVVPELLRAIDAVRPGEIRHVGTSSKRRRGTGQGP